MQRTLSASLALALLAAATPAQLTGAQAAKALAKAGKQRLAQLKTEIGLHAQQWQLDVAEFQSQALEGAPIVAVQDTLFPATSTLQAGVAAAVQQRTLDFALDARDLLQELNAGLDVLPDAFAAGAGGPLDVFREGVRKALDATYAKLRKRLVKVRKALRMP